MKAEYQGQDVKVVALSSDFENKPTKVAVKKTDVTPGVELSGATLTSERLIHCVRNLLRMAIL